MIEECRLPLENLTSIYIQS